MDEHFRKLANHISVHAGRASTFVSALVLIALWGISGPIFQFSNTWQLVINTSTTIITFLMVFLIQNTQNRDSRALHLKLDELIKASQGARNSMVSIEELSDDKLEAMFTEFHILREKYSQELAKRKAHTKST